MGSLIPLLAPIVLELLKLFFAKDTTAEAKERAAKEILAQIQEINKALKKVEETDGDTSDLEKIINRPKR
jgi:hypothetical protein